MDNDKYDMGACPVCHREVPNEDKIWTYDRYGIFWKKVCPRCEDRTSKAIAKYRFDPMFAGECLEPEDY